MTIKNVLIAVFVSLIVSFVAYLLFFGESSDDFESTSWEERIEKIGGERSYLKFSDELYKIKGVGKRHDLMHEFSRSLYKVLGSDGIVFCDSQFRYACTHEFMAQSINESGISGLSVLDDKCSLLGGANGRACSHGLGHGILSIKGYTFPDLQESLSSCKTLDNSVPCYSGVFMEYNRRLLAGGQSRAHTGDIYEPCLDVGHEFRASCFYRLPKWWTTTIFKGSSSSSDGTDSLFKMSEYCHAVEDDRNKEACIAAIGEMAVSTTDHDAARIRDVCDYVSETSRQRALCSIFAVNAYANNPNARDAKEICAGIPEQYLNECERVANNANAFVREEYLDR